MTRLEIKKFKSGYQADYFYRDKPKPPREKADRKYIITKDQVTLSFFLQDLVFEGFPVEKAFKLMQERLNRHDWLGF